MRRRYILRLILLGLCFSATLLTLLGNLYRLQLLTAKADTVDTRRYTKTERLDAARGALLDRNGRPLVTNRVTSYVKLDTTALMSNHKTANASLLALLSLCRQYNTPHTDTLPITAEPPYRYLEPLSDTARSRLERFLKKREWPADINAETLIEKLKKTYRVEAEVPEREARALIGVRYEVELRHHFGNISAYRFASDIDAALVAAIQERKLDGVSAAQETARHYETHLAAHILGRTGPISTEEYEQLKAEQYSLDAIVGKEGMEKQLESRLRGIAGSRTVETNGDGDTTGVTVDKPAQPGDNCLLTLDIELQRVAEQALSDRIAELAGGRGVGGEADAGAVVVIDVNSGEVLAMATYPTYAPSTLTNDYAKLLADPLKPLFNRAIAGTYAPGSTMKMSSAMAALQAGVVSPTATITDLGVFTAYQNVGYAPMCGLYKSARQTHGALNVAAALQVSCNYFFYETADRMGIVPLEGMANRLGLGQRSGLDLPGEQAGVLAGSQNRAAQGKTWNPGDTLQMAIGQSDNLFTPLQLANYTATIANGGTRYQPHLFKLAKSYDYKTVTQTVQPTVLAQLEFDPANLAAVQQGMRLVCQTGGTASSVFGDYPIAVAAKTGSAQVNGKTNGIFVSYAPYEQPEIAIAVVVEKGDSGGNIAPIARTIYDCYFARQLALNRQTQANQLLP